MKKLLALSLTTVLTALPMSQLTANKVVVRDTNLEWNINLSKRQEFNKKGTYESGNVNNFPLSLLVSDYAENWNTFIAKYPYFYFKKNSFMEVSIKTPVKNDMQDIYKTSDLSLDTGIPFSVLYRGDDVIKLDTLLVNGTLMLINNFIMMGVQYTVKLGNSDYGYYNVNLPSLIFTNENII